MVWASASAVRIPTDSELAAVLSRGTLGGKLYPTLAGEVSVTDESYLYGDVRRFGAVADSGTTDNKAAIDNAIESAAATHGLAYVPGSDGYYGIEQPLYMRDGVNLVGDGVRSHIRNTRTVTALNGDLRVVDFGNHTVSSLLAETSYILNAANEGDQSVTATTAAQAGNFSVGQVVYIASDALAGSAPSVQEFNEVTSVNAVTGVIGLKYGLHASFTGGQKIYTTTSGQTDPMGGVRRVVSRCRIANLALTADGGDWWHAAGGCWESLFENLFIDSRSPAVLNCFARSTMRQIVATFDDRAIEFAIGSHDSVVADFECTYKDTGKATASEPLVSLNEGAHDIRIERGRINASGHAGSRAVRFITARDCLVDQVTIDAPSISGAEMVSFSSSSGYCQRNTARNLVVRGDNSRWVNFDYGVGVTGEDNAVEHCKFYGTVSVDGVQFADGVRDGVFDCYFDNRGFTMAANASQSKVHRCRFGDRHPSFSKNSSGDVRDIETGSTADLRECELYETNASINSTTVNNTVYTTTIPLDTLATDDMIEIELHGFANGGNGTKEIRIEAGSTDIGSISLSAAQTGAFSIRARLSVLFATTTKRATAQEESAAGSNTRRSSFSLNTNTGSMNIDLEAWVGNAADSISIDQFSIRPVRRFEVAA